MMSDARINFCSQSLSVLLLRLRLWDAKLGLFLVAAMAHPGYELNLWFRAVLIIEAGRALFAFPFVL